MNLTHSLSNLSANTHTLSILVQNHFGVLSRVTGLFSRRAFNIQSLTVSHTENTKISRITVVTEGDAAVIEQMVKQLYKLVNVLQVYDHTEDKMVEQEIALLKLRANQQNRHTVLQMAKLFNAEVASISVVDETLIVRISGEPYLIDGFLDSVKDDVIEMVRSGKIAMTKGQQVT